MGSSTKQYQNNPRYNYLKGKNFTQVSGVCHGGVGVGASNSNSDAVSLTLRPEFTVLKQGSGGALGSGVCQRARQCSCNPLLEMGQTRQSSYSISVLRARPKPILPLLAPLPISSTVLAWEPRLPLEEARSLEGTRLRRGAGQAAEGQRPLRRNREGLRGQTKPPSLFEFCSESRA